MDRGSLSGIRIVTEPSVRATPLTAHPDSEWMAQVARNLTGWDGELENAQYLIHDRDAKYTAQFDAILMSSGINPIKLPARSPNLNANAERWVKSVKDEIVDCSAEKHCHIL